MYVRQRTNDGELKNLVEKARDLLTGVTPDQIRNTAELRSRIQAGMAEIKTKLDAMIIDKPKRKIRVED